MPKQPSIANCPDPSVHGNPFRYCPHCEWVEPVATVAQKPSVGRIVHYAINDDDAAKINKRRADAKNLNGAGVTLASQGLGPQIHIGNEANAGDVYPALIVKVFPTTINLQVFLDGNDTFWATSKSQANADGYWSWPPRD